jgi:hypothetical protein
MKEEEEEEELRGLVGLCFAINCKDIWSLLTFTDPIMCPPQSIIFFPSSPKHYMSNSEE